jgi:hypothetical protein
MRSKSARIHTGSLLLTVTLCATFRSGGEAAAPQPPTCANNTPAARLTPDGKEAVAAALERLRQTGSFNHPDYPWVVRARRVRGDALYFVEFLRRREDGRGFDAVGKAVQATLAYVEEYEPTSYPESEPLPVRRNRLVVRVCQARMETEDCIYELFDERVFDLALPARLPEGGFRPHAEAEVRLSRDQRKALSQEYALHRAQKMLLAAFGDECADLLRAHIGHSETGRTVLAYDQIAPIGSGRRYRFATLAVARFDRAGEVLLRFRGRISPQRRANSEGCCWGTIRAASSCAAPAG